MQNPIFRKTQISLPLGRAKSLNEMYRNPLFFLMEEYHSIIPIR